MKRLSVACLLPILLLTACERSVKPAAESATRPAAPTARRESIDQTPELETHPLAVNHQVDNPTYEPLNIELKNGQPLLKHYFNAIEPGFAATVNRWCPVMQKMKLNASTAVEHTTEFEGQIVGFCCEDCRDAWASMDDAERRERLKTVMAKP